LNFQPIIKYRKIFYAVLIILAFLATVIILTNRIKLEKENRTVDISMDYSGLEEMCRRENIEIDEVLRKLKEAGITSLSLNETTLEELQARGELRWTTGADLLNALSFSKIGLPQDYRKIQPGSICVVNCSPELENKLIRNLNLLWGAGSYQLLEVSKNDKKKIRILQFFGLLKDIPYQGLGFDRELIEKLDERGFGIILRPENRSHLNRESIIEYMESIKKMPGVTTLIFGGANNEVIGYPRKLDSTARAFRATGLSFGDVEVPGEKARQKGAQYLGLRIPDMTARVQSITALHLAKMTPQVAVGKFRLGVRERNIRLIYLRPYPCGIKGKSMLQTNLDYVSSVKKSLTGSGFSTGTASRFPLYKPPVFLLLLITMGVAGVFMLLVDYLYFDRGPLGLVVIFGGILFSLFLIMTGKFHMLQKLTALAAAIIFPVYAFAANFEEMEVIETHDKLSGVVGYALFVFLKITTISILGGLMMGAAMASTSFMLSIDKFSGVKAALILPLLIILLIYYLKGSDKRQSFKDLMMNHLYIWQIILMGIMFAAGWIYIVRSGNAPPSAVSGGERSLRIVLEKLMWVRPRFKEFLIGHPALMLTWAMSYMHQYTGLGILVIFAGMGQAGIMDTFAHIHTPLYITLVRVLLGALLGSVMGTILICLVWLFRKKFPPGKKNFPEKNA